MNYKQLALFLGLLALAISLASIGFPLLVSISVDRVLVSITGVLTLFLAFRVISSRRPGEPHEVVTPDPELTPSTITPGDDLESALGQFLDSRQVYFHRSRVQEALRSAAVEVLSRFGGYTGEEAIDVVDAGTWTDDIYAAGFLGRGDAPPLSLRTQLRDVLRRESALQREVRHCVEAIATLARIPPAVDRGSRPVRRRIGRTRNTSRNTELNLFTTSTDFDEETADDTTYRSHFTDHWRGVSVVALLGIGVGILAEEPAVLLVGVIGIGFVAFSRSGERPLGTVTVDRTLSDTRPAPGDEVEVTVTVTNDGEDVLPDLRLVDGVPEALSVDHGSPRLGTALRPGESTTFEYTVPARRGTHTFGPVLLVARNVSNTMERKQFLPSKSTLTCVPRLRPLAVPVPLREQPTQYVGQVGTGIGGEGIEFYATREYRRGDSLSRIDWNRRARTGELTTVEFREERAATVVLVIDARNDAYVAPDQTTPHAVDRAVAAATRIYTTLVESGDRVGIAAMSPSCWLSPGSGADHRARARQLLATHPALTTRPKQTRSSVFTWRSQFLRRIETGAQVIFLSPLVENREIRFARHIDERGYPLTVISPDPTNDETAGQLLARIARNLHIATLREVGIPVVDWTPDEPIDVALAQHHERWSR